MSVALRMGSTTLGFYRGLCQTTYNLPTLENLKWGLPLEFDVRIFQRDVWGLKPAP